MIFRGFTYRLRPSHEQEQQFLKFAGVCRLVWNLALEQRQSWWRQYQASTGDNLNYVTQARQLKDLRAEFDFIREVSQTSEQRVLKDLDTAFRNFFAGRGGFPKMKRKGVNDAFSFCGREVIIQKLNAKWSKVRLPKIGWVKFRCTRPIAGDIREATVTRTALGWQISLGCLIDRDIADIGGRVGIDRGITVPIAMSDGTMVVMPESISRIDALHKRAQRICSRRKRGSKRYAKAVKRAARLKARQARIRKDWAHRTTTDIARKYGTVVIERLRAKDMSKSAKGTIEQPGKNVAQKRGLNRAILNVGWLQIETMLTYKAFKLIKVNPAFSSQTCSVCGTVDKQSRKNQASFVCTACGHSDNADVNAASVILSRGNTVALNTEGSCSKHPVEVLTSFLEIPCLQAAGRC